MEVPSLRNIAEISNVSMQYMKAEIFFYPPITVNMGFPSDACDKEFTYQCRRHETQVQSLGWEDPLEEGMQLTPVFLPGKSHGQRSLVGYSPRNHKVKQTEVA